MLLIRDKSNTSFIGYLISNSSQFGTMNVV